MLTWLPALIFVTQTTGSIAAPQECIALSSKGRVLSGSLFSAPLGRGLEFRLVPDLYNADGKPSGWSILVTPAGEPGRDFLWVVSPPFQTAPQRIIGNGYGTAARESIQIERHLRFVLSDADYEAAVQMIDMNLAEPEKLLAGLEALGRGSLTLTVTAAGLRSGNGPPQESIEWIEFEGRVCIPR
jgi:hypothetical protein